MTFQLVEVYTAILFTPLSARGTIDFVAGKRLASDISSSSALWYLQRHSRGSQGYIDEMAKHAAVGNSLFDRLHFDLNSNMMPIDEAQRSPLLAASASEVAESLRAVEASADWMSWALDKR